MSTVSWLPIRLGHLVRPVPKSRHRAVDEVERLTLLLGGARATIAGLYVQLDDKDREHAAVIDRIDELHGETVRGLEAENEQLRRQMEIGALAEAAATRTQEIPAIPESAVRPVPLHQAREAGHLGPVT